MGNAGGHKSPSSGEEIALIQKLRIHQVDLKAQNEEVRCAQEAVFVEKKYAQDLNKYSPVSYLILCGQFLILDTNLAICTLLGIDRTELLQQPVSRFIHPEDQDLFYFLRERLFSINTPASVDLRMQRVDGSSTWVRLDMRRIPVDGSENTLSFLVVITDIHDMKQIEETLYFLAAHLSGECFFKELTRYLTQALRVDFASIDKLEADGLSARNLVAYHDGSFRDNLSYVLKDTPCGHRTCKDICSFPANVCQLFPQHEILKELRAESFVGVTLRGGAGQPIGLIVVIGCQPLAGTARAEAVLKLVAVRAGGELERLEMTQVLRASEQRYALACSAVHDGLWEWHIPSGKGFFSNRYYELLGYEDNGFPADYATWRTLLHPQDIDRVEEELGTAIDLGKRFIIEFRLQRKSGDWLWVSACGRAVEEDTQGKALRMIGTISDITERKLAVEALLGQYETYQDILATTPDGFWLTDFQGNILDVNDSYCRQSGYSRQELLAMHPFDLDVKESSVDTATHIQHIIENGVPSRFETLHRRKDRSTWHVEVSVGMSNKAGGQFVVFLRDITERKQTEEMLTRSLQEKEMVVEELHNRIKIHVRVIEDVIALQGRLANSLQEKQVLLQEVHHRVKNNLQVVHSMLSLQARRVPDSETRLLFTASMNRIYTMSLIHERLCHAKDLSSIDFNSYLKSLVDAILVTHSSSGITCIVETEPIFLDLTVGTPCGLIAHELVTNSITHAFPEDREGMIWAGINKHSRGFLTLTVTDNGIGYRPDLQPASTSLGLEIVKGLTAQIHGTIESSTTDGTRVSIIFPEKFSPNGGVNL